jgi:glucose/arabinose dehydrogenase/mono/diheme cytochrome c family protein
MFRTLLVFCPTFVTLLAIPAATVAPAAPPAPGPAPVLSPQESLSRFKVAPGYRIELVAAEPLIEAPVAMAFDADGRLWVVEMRNFMPDPEGKGEDAPTGRITILDDRDGDGLMDTRTVFLDQLVLPRSIAFVGGGVLIAAPPELIHCYDKNKDDRCDSPVVVSKSYGTRKNPEHDANGFVLALDNWLYSANIGERHRFVGGTLASEPTISRGQWGIAQDDVGRLVFNANSDYVRGDGLPVYLRRAHLKTTREQNVDLDDDETTWPGRPNFGVNRGYKDGSLRPDGTLAKFTAACGPTVYRGDQFPEDARGNVFVAEPAANFVRRSVVSETDGVLRARNAYAKTEFVTSTDERFRPVNLTTGPDGALYVADMYRGLIQHRIYLTPFLRQQVVDRGLDRPIDRGRIWRVVSTDKALGPRPRLGQAKSPALLEALAHPNGWWRDTAQRLLVERKDSSVTPALARLVRSAPDPRTRLHALFTLEGLGRLGPTLVAGATRDPDRFVSQAALALRERSEDARLYAFLAKLAERPSLDRSARERLRGRELDALARLLADKSFTEERPGRVALVRALADAVFARNAPDEVLQLLDLVGGEPRGTEWRQVALLDAVAAAKAAPGASEKLALPASPKNWARLVRSPNEAVKAKAEALAAWIGASLPRATQKPANKAARGLSAEEKARFDRGKALYPGICGACHQPSGLGEEGKGPPLVDSPWVLGAPERLVRIAIHGLRGPVKVGARTFNMDMPAMGGLSDDQLADLLTYVRAEKDWGHDAPAITPATIARIRAATEARAEAWTEPELLKVQ